MSVHRVFGGGIDLDRVVAVVAHVDERVGDEVDLVAVVARVVAGRRVRAAGEEEVREAACSAHRGTSSVRRPSASVERDGRSGRGSPCASSAPVPKSKPVAHTTMSNSCTPSAVSMPRLGHAQDRRLLEVDERDVRVVEHLVVAGDERRPLLAEAVILRDQPARRCRDPRRCSRIFSAMNSHHSAFAAGSNSRSV